MPDETRMPFDLESYVERVHNHTTLDTTTAAAGVPRLTSHGLRHTAATHMVTNPDRERPS